MPPIPCWPGSRVSSPVPSTWVSSASASAWVVARASSSSPPGTTPRTGFYLGGRLGAQLKEFVCKHTIKHLADEARKPGSLTWVKDDQRQDLLRAKRGEAPATAERTER